MKDRLAIEVKGKEIVTSKDLKGLKMLREENLLEKYIVAANVPSDYVEDDIHILNWKSFLNNSCFNPEKIF